MGNGFMTELGVGGLIAFLIVREVMQGLRNKGQNNNDDIRITMLRFQNEMQKEFRTMHEKTLESLNGIAEKQLEMAHIIKEIHDDRRHSKI